MQNFAGKIAVVTGGASGMGRELVRQLVAAGCHVSMCDLSVAEMEESRALALAAAPASDVRVSNHMCDVGDEAALLVIRDEVLAAHHTDHIHLLFNNAGIGGGGSLFSDSREAWERTFDICWGGVYHGTRAFLPALVAADEAHIVNTSSVNGFWASIGPDPAAHRLLGGEVRGEGVHRGADDRSTGQRPARPRLGRDAGPHRNLHRGELVPSRSGRGRRGGGRDCRSRVDDVPRARTDDRRRSGVRDPRRRPGEPLADPGRR